MSILRLLSVFLAVCNCVIFAAETNAQTPPTSIDVTDDHLTVVRQMVDAGEGEKALAYTEVKLAESPGDPALVAAKGMALRSLKQFDAAVAYLDSGISEHPYETELIFQRALAHRSLGNAQLFEADFTRMIQLGDYIGYSLAAPFYHSRNDLVKEVHAYTKLLEIWPSDTNAHSWQESRAIAFTGLQVLDWAQYDISSSMEKVSTTSKLLLRGEIGILSGKSDLADADFNLAIENTDVPHVPTIRKINAILSAHEFDRAAELVAEFKIQYPDLALREDVLAIEKRIRDHNELRDLQRSAAKKNRRPSGLLTTKEINSQRKRIIDLIGDDGSVADSDAAELKQLLLQHAHIGMFANDVEYAAQLLSHLEKIRSQDQLTTEESATELTVRAWLRMQADEYKKAEKLIRQAIELAPGFASAQRVAASICFQTDELQQALEHADKSIEIDPFNSVNLGYRGLINSALDRYKESARDCFRALELDPGNKWVLTILEELANLQGLSYAALRYQGERLGVNYQSELLERAEYWIQLDLPQLALADVEEYASIEDQERESERILLKARAIYLWMKDCEIGGGSGPDEELVIEAALAAQKAFPNFYLSYMFQSEAQLRTDDFASSAQSAMAALERIEQPAAYLFELASQATQMAGTPSETKKLIRKMEAVVQDNSDLERDFHWALSTASRSVELAEYLEQLDLTTDTSNKLLDMQPTRTELAKVFDNEYAAKLAVLCDKDKAEITRATIPKTHTKLRIATATTEDFLATDEVIRKYHFPYGMRLIAHRMAPDVIWHLVSFTPDDDPDGLKFTAMVKIADRWVTIGRPWRAESN